MFHKTELLSRLCYRDLLCFVNNLIIVAFSAIIMPSLEAGQEMQNEEEEDEEDDGRNAGGLHTIAEEEEIGNHHIL